MVLAIAGALFTGCTSQRNLSVNVPAEVPVPTSARRIVLMDRTEPRSGFSNTFEALTSRESGLDKEQGREMNEVLREALGELGERFEVVTAPGRYEGSGTGVLSDPLNWDTIIQVCSRADADILIALEALDADVNYDFNERTVQEIVNGYPTSAPRVEVRAQRKTTVRYGWRVYDRRGRTILDMFTDRSTSNQEGIGSTKQNAKDGLPAKRGVVDGLGRAAARSYARRFAPTSSFVKRTFYSGSDRRLRSAYNLSRRNNWEGAIHVWESMLTDPKAKLRGKACFNIAVAYEALGDLVNARVFALRSASEFGNKWGMGYAAELDVRMKDEERARSERELLGQGDQSAR